MIEVVTHTAKCQMANKIIKIKCRENVDPFFNGQI